MKIVWNSILFFITVTLLNQLPHFLPNSFSQKEKMPEQTNRQDKISNGENQVDKPTQKYKTFDLVFDKPDLDDRQYRFIELPNGLKALLIHDPTTDRAAASLDVNIGAFEDPEDLPGLAHFCEHLLFMGSEKYPDENEYSSFLSKHGGSSNAYTGSQNTNYFFEVNYEHLYGSLDRFSGFFTCPLFKKNSTDKEINAVDSENKKNLQDDTWRLYQLDKSLSYRGHPYHKFSTGNLETLGTSPRENGIDIRDALLQYYESSYSANLMKLCILGREDLDTLASWTYELFESVRNIERELPKYDSPVLSQDELGKIIMAKPIKDLRKLEITFVVPDTERNWDSKPTHILSHLIGHEGSGSLLAHLKTLGWANELSAGGHTVSEGNAVFTIDIDLTKEGLKKYQEVARIAFQYIEMLRVSLPQDWIYFELEAISRANFKFKQKMSPARTVSGLAKVLEREYIPVQHILSTSVFTRNEPDKVLEILESLTVKNSRMTLIAKSLQTNLTEKWYGTEYSIEPYSEEFIQALNKPGLNGALHLPRPNEFIANNFTVDRPRDWATLTPLEEPHLLRVEPYGKLWYKKDDRFWQPNGYIYISLRLPHTRTSILTSSLTTLYVQLVNDTMKDLQYDAACANLRLILVKTNQGLDITISGFNHKLIVLLTRFLQGVKEFVPSRDRFQIFKDKVVQHLQNLLYEVPYSQISSIYNYLINDGAWSTEERLKVTEMITYEQLVSFIPMVYEELYFETLVHGNMKYDEAIEIHGLVRSVLGSLSKGGEIYNLQIENNRLRSYFLPRGESFRYETYLRDKQNVNSCIEHVTQIGIYSERLSAMAGLFAQIIHEPCFDTLRTKEQLGYVVFSSSLNNHGAVNLRILVQSEHTTQFLEWRIVEFYEKIGELLSTMSEDDFEKHKRALCKTLLQKYKNMEEESARYTASIYIGDYNFLHRHRKAEIVQGLTKEMMLEFYNEYIVGPHATRLVIHLKSQVANANVSESELDTSMYPSGELIDNVASFKSKLFLAPSRQPPKQFEVYVPS